MALLQLSDQDALTQAIFGGATTEVETLITKNPELVHSTDPEKRTPLHAAAFQRNVQMVKTLLENGADANAKDLKWVTPMHRACAENADEIVEILIDYRANVMARTRSWQTPLHTAAENDAYSCVHKLLDNLPNPNITDRMGRTALHHAAAKDNMLICELLLNRGAMVNASDKLDCRPLHYAVSMGFAETVEVLISAQSDINAAQSRNRWTPLHLAVSEGLTSIVSLLIDAGADLNVLDAQGNTPLHLALRNGHFGCCEELVGAGADLDAVNYKGETLLHIAAKLTDGLDFLSFLLSKNVNINRTNANGWTPLHMTAIHGRFTKSKILIDYGAQVDCPNNKNGLTPLHLAAHYGHDILLSTLFIYGANPSRKTYEGRTPLHICCLSDYMECCRKLISQAGVCINERDDLGMTPTHCAAYSGSIECLDLLTSNGADFKLKDNFQRLPLHYAAVKHSFQCIFTLVGIGSPINERDSEGCTPLHLVAGFDFEGRCIEYLLNHKGDPNIRDNRGYKPLHYAINQSNLVGVKTLLNVTKDIDDSNDVTSLHLAAKTGNLDIFGAILIVKYTDVNVQTSEGISPLILAARDGNFQSAHLLLRFNAKVSLCDAQGMSPVHYSAKNGHYRCLDLLLNNSEEANVVNMLDSQNRTALMLAAVGNHTKCVQTLLKCGADPSIMDKDGHTALSRAVFNGKSKIVNLLLAAKSPTNTIDIHGKTLLHLAVLSGDLDSLKLLMQNLTDEQIVMKDEKDCSVLHWACFKGDSAVLEHVLERGVFKELEGNSCSPVHCACLCGSEPCLNLLLKHFGDKIVHLTDTKHRTPLHIAAKNGHLECAKILVGHGARLQVHDCDFRTPLIVAAIFGQCAVVEFLLLHDKNTAQSSDSEGNTALHWACLNMHERTALVIIEHCHANDSALINVANKEQKTPLHIAARNGLENVTRELLTKGASVSALDNQGLTPALSCASSYNVAKCLQLIIQAMQAMKATSDAKSEEFTSFLSKIPCLLLEKPNPIKSTQTNISLIQDPDIRQLISLFTNAVSVTNPDKKESYKKHPLGLNTKQIDMFLRESVKEKVETKISNKSEVVGKKLHKSCGDISLSSTQLNKNCNYKHKRLTKLFYCQIEKEIPTYDQYKKKPRQEYNKSLDKTANRRKIEHSQLNIVRSPKLKELQIQIEALEEELDLEQKSNQIKLNILDEIKKKTEKTEENTSDTDQMFQNLKENKFSNQHFSTNSDVDSLGTSKNLTLENAGIFIRFLQTLLQIEIYCYNKEDAIFDKVIKLRKFIQKALKELVVRVIDLDEVERILKTDAIIKDQTEEQETINNKNRDEICDSKGLENMNNSKNISSFEILNEKLFIESINEELEKLYNNLKNKVVLNKSGTDLIVAEDKITPEEPEKIINIVKPCFDHIGGVKDSKNVISKNCATGETKENTNFDFFKDEILENSTEISSDEYDDESIEETEEQLCDNCEIPMEQDSDDSHSISSSDNN